MMKASPESEEWASIESMMADVLDNHSTNCQETIQRTITCLDTLTATSDRLTSSSREITTNINASIQVEKDALAVESNELSHQLSSVQELENQITTLTQQNDTIVAKRQEAEQNIPIYQSIASQQVDELEENEYKHVQQLAKHKNALSLHALMTNIKWDYSECSGDVLAGEVSLPGKSVHKRFCIEKNGNSDMSKFDIADKLWCMIEG